MAMACRLAPRTRSLRTERLHLRIPGLSQRHSITPASVPPALQSPLPCCTTSEYTGYTQLFSHPDNTVRLRYGEVVDGEHGRVLFGSSGPVSHDTQARRVGRVSPGCPRTLVDSERILTQLRLEGYEVVPSYEDADVVLVSTCGFIDSALAYSPPKCSRTESTSSRRSNRQFTSIGSKWRPALSRMNARVCSRGQAGL